MLKVLCVLSFVGLGFSILTSVFTVIYSSLVDIETLDPGSPMYYFAYAKNESLKNLVVELISLFGVLLMWRMRRKGYYIYLVAESFLYFEFAYQVIRLNWDTSSAFQVGLEMIWPLLFDIIFFFLYATQLKHMNGSRLSPGSFLYFASL